MAASSSRGRSSSPFGFRKPSSPYSSTSSSLSLMNGRLIPRSCSSSASSQFFSSGNGISTRSMTPNRDRSDSGSKAHSTRALIGFASVEELVAEAADLSGSGDSISVTVRFRPLSEREFQRGDEIAWYADGDKVVRSEYNPATAYASEKNVRECQVQSVAQRIQLACRDERRAKQRKEVPALGTHVGPTAMFVRNPPRPYVL